MGILLLNFILYAIWFSITYYREKRITIYSILVLFYTVVAGLGYYTVSDKIYFDVFGYQSPAGLRLEPYFYTLVTYMILFWPLKNIQLDDHSFELLFSKGISSFVRIWIVYFSLFTILKLVEAIASISLGLGDAYDARHMDGAELFVYDNIILQKFNGYGFFLLNATVPFIMAYMFISISLKRMSYSYAVFLILLCFIPSILSGIAMGSRGSLFMSGFCFIFFVPLFWRYIPKSFLSKIYLYITVFVSLIMFYSWIITSDRVGKGSEGLNSILRYFGESFPNLGFSFWDKVQYHPMGERLFPNFLIENEKALYTSVDESYQYWAFRTGVPVLTFKTYFGDLYIEFGVFYALLFVIVCSIFVKRYFKINKVNIFNLSFLYYYYQLCIFAFAGFTKGGHLAFFQLIIIVLVIVVLKFLSKKGKNLKPNGGKHTISYFKLKPL
jgi:oligosaccharide repeat unit polymerase